MNRWYRGISIPNFLAVAAVIYVTVWSLHPALLLAGSTITGGDTGAHLATVAFLRQHVSSGLTSWYPGWFDGMPLYSYYFVLPDLIAALGSYILGLSVALKLVTVVGSVLLPISAFAFGRWAGAKEPIPALLSLATLPFLFDSSYTIDGGNLFSTLAGEYAFSLSLSFALLTIGLFLRGMRTGRGHARAALMLAATLAAHVLPWLFAIVMIVAAVGMEWVRSWRWFTDPTDVIRGRSRRATSFALLAGFGGVGLSMWWLWPFAASQSLTNSMGYTNDTVGSWHQIFQKLGWWNATGGVSGDRWVLVLAGLALVVALWTRERVGVLLSAGAIISLVAFVADPQSVIWNERLVPFWFLCVHLLSGWLVGYLLWWLAGWWSKRHEGPDGRENFVSAGIYAAIVVSVLMTVIPMIPSAATALGITTDANQASAWATWNYSGYEGKPAWPEYHQLMTEMSEVGARTGCGRAMWEYSATQNRFGTPMALMLMPYWTNNCIDSEEGLFFESSATTPYHFLNQSEMSVAPSQAQVGLRYGGLDMTQGVSHLQALGVRYFVAFSPEVIAEAKVNPALVEVTPTHALHAPAAAWHIYVVKNSELVTGLSHLPVVNPALGSRSNWLAANQSWWLNYPLPSTVLAAAGPPSWPRTKMVVTSSPPQVSEKISQIVVTSNKLSFTTSRIGVATLVKISYFPRWRVRGAEGPYRVSPNLMVVVPTSTHVELTYGASLSMRLGECSSALSALGLWWLARRHRRYKLLMDRTRRTKSGTEEPSVEMTSSGCDGTS